MVFVLSEWLAGSLPWAMLVDRELIKVLETAIATTLHPIPVVVAITSSVRPCNR